MIGWFTFRAHSHLMVILEEKSYSRWCSDESLVEILHDIDF